MHRRTFFIGFSLGCLVTLAAVALVYGVLMSSPLPLPEEFSVTRVVDGDTIDVRTPAGATERVRIIGIDTPEMADPRSDVECFGPEASERMQKLLSGKTVTLEKNPAEDRDVYGRLLRYVFLSNEDVGAGMIAEGYAVSTCKKFPHPKCDAYDHLAKNAASDDLGLWGACAK